MTYNIHSLWDQHNIWTCSFVKGHTSITKVEDGLDLLWRNGVSADKIVMGYGFYDRGLLRVIHRFLHLPVVPLMTWPSQEIARTNQAFFRIIVTLPLILFRKIFDTNNYHKRRDESCGTSRNPCSGKTESWWSLAQ
jgi:hypothetical protein